MMMMFPIFLYIYYMYINKLLRDIDTMFYYYSFGINMTTKKKTHKKKEENSKKKTYKN